MKVRWHPTPVFLPGKSHGRRSLVGCSPGGRKDWATSLSFFSFMDWRRKWHDWATSLSFFSFMDWRRKWQSTPVFLPGESQGRGSLVSCRLWGHTESDTTERLSLHFTTEEKREFKTLVVFHWLSCCDCWFLVRDTVYIFSSWGLSLMVLSCWWLFYCGL